MTDSEQQAENDGLDQRLLDDLEVDEEAAEKVQGGKTSCPCEGGQYKPK